MTSTAAAGLQVTHDDGAYRAHLHATVVALHRAARAEPTLTVKDLDVVLTGRRAVLDLLTVVHGELTSAHPNNRPIYPHDIEGHPVEALGRALARYPRPAGELSPTDVALSRPVSDAGRAWRDVARHATVSHHAWASGAGELLAPDDQWAAIADVAGVANVLSRLDIGLVLATAGSRTTRALTDILRNGLDHGLGLAARETLRLAARGPLPETGPDRAPRPPLLVVPVQNATQLPGAQARLVAMLDHGGDLRPERLPTLAALQARACVSLADALAARQPAPERTNLALADGVTVSSTTLQAALRRHAEALRQATLRRNSIASVVVGDGRAVRQASEISRVLQADPAAVAADAELLGEVVGGIAATTRALSSAAGRALESGAWMVPSFGVDLDAPLWHVWQRPDPVPSPVTAVRRAAVHGIELARLVGQTAPSPPALSSRRGARGAAAAAVEAAVGKSASPTAGTGRRPANDLLSLSSGRPRIPAFAPVPAAARRR